MIVLNALIENDVSFRNKELEHKDVSRIITDGIIGSCEGRVHALTSDMSEKEIDDKLKKLFG